MKKLAFISLLLLLVALPLVVACEGDDKPPATPVGKFTQMARDLGYGLNPPEPVEHKYSAQEAVAIVKDYLFDQAETYRAKLFVTKLTETYSATDWRNPNHVWDVGAFLLYEESKTVVPIGAAGKRILLQIAQLN